MFDPAIAFSAETQEGCHINDEPQFHLGNNSNNIV